MRAEWLVAEGDVFSFLPAYQPTGWIPEDVSGAHQCTWTSNSRLRKNTTPPTGWMMLISFWGARIGPPFCSLFSHLSSSSYVLGSRVGACLLSLSNSTRLGCSSCTRALAVRENILRANASDIRPWWIYHHYSTMIMAMISLTWEIKGEPNCAEKQRGVQLFLQWAILQAVAMLLQNQYQRQRLYTRIALEKAKRMDIVWGETAVVDGQLWLLCPILFILQGFEAYVGMQLLRTAFVRVATEWQISFCGFLLIFMAAGNFLNTVQTLMTKSRFKSKMKISKSKQALE